QFPVVVRQGAACEVDAGNPQLDPTDNWDFELGLKTWTRSGDAFEHQPTVGDNVHVQRIPELKDQYEAGIGGDYWKDLEFPIGHHG
ncbi:MAG TPA: hypothetical protein DCM86_12195, partial [Verrucomicrobiales bacterium]|nr:hypothetical protein [Verrucomicrobiales bacterium]